MQTIRLSSLPVSFGKLCKKVCAGHMRRYTCFSNSIICVENEYLHRKPLIFLTEASCNQCISNRMKTMSIHTTPRNSFAQSIWKERLQRFMGFGPRAKATLNMSGSNMYLCCADDINVQLFKDTFQMPDTFVSWYLVTELHVWMAIVRIMHEEKKYALKIRNSLVKDLWTDVDERSKKLGSVNPSIRKEQIQDLGGHFNAALFSYDEGLLTNDLVLAGAVWRIFFHNGNEDIRLIEMLVGYIRRTIYHLDSLDGEALLTTGKISWLPLIEKTSFSDDRQNIPRTTDRKGIMR